MTTIHWILLTLWLAATVALAVSYWHTRASWARTGLLLCVMPPVGVLWLVTQRRGEPTPTPPVPREDEAAGLEEDTLEDTLEASPPGLAPTVHLPSLPPRRDPLGAAHDSLAEDTAPADDTLARERARERIHARLRASSTRRERADALARKGAGGDDDGAR